MSLIFPIYQEYFDLPYGLKVCFTEVLTTMAAVGPDGEGDSVTTSTFANNNRVNAQQLNDSGELNVTITSDIDGLTNIKDTVVEGQKVTFVSFHRGVNSDTIGNDF